MGVNRYSKLPAAARKAFPVSKGTNGIGLDDILRSYLGLLSLGQTDYEAVANKKNDNYFKQSLGIKKASSAEILRQRFDDLAEKLRPLADASSIYIHPFQGWLLNFRVPMRNELPSATIKTIEIPKDQASRPSRSAGRTPLDL